MNVPLYNLTQKTRLKKAGFLLDYLPPYPIALRNCSSLGSSTGSFFTSAGGTGSLIVL